MTLRSKLKICTRLGNSRIDGKPRLLKIVLKMKRKQLSCVMKLRQIPDSDDYDKIYVNSDLTKKQQKESNLYCMPDNRWVIYKGKVTRADSITRNYIYTNADNSLASKLAEVKVTLSTENMT